MLADRRDELSGQRVQTVNRLQRLLSELLPGQRTRDLSAAQAKAMLATVRPRDVAGRPADGSPPTSLPTWSLWRRRSRRSPPS